MMQSMKKKGDKNKCIYIKYEIVRERENCSWSMMLKTKVLNGPEGSKPALSSLDLYQ